MNESKGLKILLIIPNLGRGGAQQVFRDQLQYFSTKYNAVGCVFNWDDTFEDDRQPNIISLDVPAGKNPFGKIICFFKRVSALKKIKRQHQIDISISHLEGADYINLLSKKKDRVICWIHGTKAFDENINGVVGLLRRKILIPLTYRFSDKIVTVSDGIRQELFQTFRVPTRKTTTIYNSFILEDIVTKASQTVSPQAESIFAGSPIIVTHCRLSRQKNLFALLDIYFALKKQVNARLMILGDGELREQLLSHCLKNGLYVYTVWNHKQSVHANYDIYFMGYERNPYPYLQRSTLYAMTSSWEGFPLSLCEAMACGLPVITTDCYTGPREIIAPNLKTSQPVNQPTSTDYGVLMPLASSDSTKVWSDTIISLLDRPEMRNHLSAKGKERILMFDRKEIGKQWSSVVEQYRS